MPKRRSPSPKRSTRKAASPKRGITKKGYSGETKIKRARGAYTFFYKDVFPSLRDKYPNYRVTEIASEAGKLWRKMSEERKRPYEEQARKDKLRSQRERERVKASKPKREPTEYQIWAKKKGPEIKKKHPNWSFGDVNKELGRMWRAKKE